MVSLEKGVPEPEESKGPVNNSSEKYQKLFDEAKAEVAAAPDQAPVAQEAVVAPEVAAKPTGAEMAQANLDQIQGSAGTVVDKEQAHFEAKVANATASQAAEMRASAREKISHIGDTHPGGEPWSQDEVDYQVGMAANDLNRAGDLESKSRKLANKAGEAYQVIQQAGQDNARNENQGSDPADKLFDMTRQTPDKS